MTTAVPPRLDIVILVYNEGANILRRLQSTARTVATPKRVLICYDREDDDTLPAVRNDRSRSGDRVRAQPRPRRALRRSRSPCRPTTTITPASSRP